MLSNILCDKYLRYTEKIRLIWKAGTIVANANKNKLLRL